MPKEDRMPARKKSRRSAATKSRSASPRKKGAAKRRVVAKKRPAKAKKKAARKSAAKPSRRPTPSLPPAPPNAIGFVTQHMDYTTHDIDALRRFYVDTLGFKDFNYDTNFHYLFVRTGHSSSLGFMPPMPGMGEPSPAKEPTLYIFVADVDKAYAALAAKGIHFEGPPANMPWGHRVVSTLDPEGRRVMLAAPLASVG
jgi:predicted enzyme related to lactoylglutathione lyase